MKDIDDIFAKVDLKRRTAGDQLEDGEGKFRDLMDDLEAVGRDEKEILEKKKTFEDDLARYQKMLEKLPKETNTKQQTVLLKQSEKKLVELQRKKNQMEKEARKCDSQTQRLKRELRDLEARIQETQDNSLTRLTNVVNANHLPKYHIDAYNWVQQNSGLFKEQVDGPLFLQCNVQHETEGRFLEKLVSFRLKWCYVTHHKDDFIRLGDEFKSRRWVIMVTASRPHRNLPPNPNEASLKSMGVGFLHESIQVQSPAIKNVLIDMARLDQAGFLRDESVLVDGQEKQPMDLMKQSKNDRGGFTMFFTPRTVTTIKFSAYDDNALKTVNQLEDRAPTYFTPVDNTEELEEQQQQLEDLTQQLAGLEKDKTDLRSRLQQMDEKIRFEKNHQKGLKDVGKRRQQLEEAVMQRERDLQDLQQQLGTFKPKRVKLGKRITEHHAVWLEKLRELNRILEEWSKTALSRAGKVLNNKHRSILLARKKQEMSTFSIEFEQAKKKYQAKLSTVKALKRKSDEMKAKAMAEAPLDQYKEDFQMEWMPDTVEELDSLFTEYQTQMEMAEQKGESEILKKFERLQESIQTSSETVERMEERLGQIRRNLQGKEDAWLGPLKDIISKIAEYFRRYFAAIGCEGNVELRCEPPGKYDAYSIHILVRYRKDAPLKALKRSCQSGGERAVATMLYLLTLQQITDCPFRLVDEVNQGMDPDNERKVFEQISLSSKMDNTPQYFVVTPKLLPALHFTPNISLLCVFNGPHIQSFLESQAEKFLTVKTPKKKKEQEAEGRVTVVAVCVRESE